MSREIKFRVWVSIGNCFSYFNIYEGANLGIAGGVSEPQQFTGMLDKNGKEIYEGDVIKYSRLFEASPNEPAHIKELTSFIRYESAKFGFDLKGFNDMFYDLSDEYNVEVIGNIFENKDLLCDHMNSHISVNGNCYNCGKLVFPKKPENGTPEHIKNIFKHNQ